MEISDIDKESTIGYNKQEKYKKRHKAAKKRRYKGDRKDMQNAESRMAVHTHTHTHTHTQVF